MAQSTHPQKQSPQRGGDDFNASGEPMIQDTQSGSGAILGYESGNDLAIDISYRLCCFSIMQPNPPQGVSLYLQSVSPGVVYRFR